VEEVAALTGFTAAGKNLELTCLVEPEVPRLVRGDPARVRQVLINLAGNAVKFTERGDVRLSLGVSDDGHEVCFTVTDTGIGIAASDLQRLFRPFTQLDSGLTRRHGGTGLGLYISQRLATLLGGRIEVASQSGKGSTFRLVLPREYAAA
jgi:hypothetical protein